MARNLQVELADRPLGLMPSHAWNSLANRGRHLLQTVSLDGQECLCASLFLIERVYYRHASMSTSKAPQAGLLPSPIVRSDCEAVATQWRWSGG